MCKKPSSEIVLQVDDNKNKNKKKKNKNKNKNNIEGLEGLTDMFYRETRGNDYFVVIVGIDAIGVSSFFILLPNVEE